VKRFLRLLAVFLLPVVLLYALFAGALAATRERAGLDEITAAAADGTLVLYGTSHHENFAAFKLRAAAQKKAALLVLGTSRSMQLRSEFFSTDSFYNAGGGVRTMADYEDFLSRLPADALPETLLLVLDQNMFNTTWRESSPTDPQSYGELTLDFADWVDTLLRTGFDYGNGKFALRDVLRARDGVYGMAAAASGTGFAADGSYRYGKNAEKNLDDPQRNFSATYRNIDFGELRFAYGDTPDALALSQLSSLLDWCAGKNIRVVGLLPPFPPSVTARMKANGGYAYLDQLYGAIAPLFAAHGGEFYDFTVMDAPDEEYLDGFHGGDRVYARIALALGQESMILGKSVNSVTLRQLLDTTWQNPRSLS